MFALLVVLSGELMLLVSVLWIRKLSVWPGDLFRLFFELFSVLALSEFLRLSSSFRNLLLCRLLVVLYAKYIWEWTLDLRCEARCYLITELSFVLFDGDNSLERPILYILLFVCTTCVTNLAKHCYFFFIKSIRTLLKQLMIIWFFILISATHQVYLLF